MSGPYRFTQESARTPLDRRTQNPAPVAQPVSFKTNVNRMKTKKWVEAKRNIYDGDDWGDYDEYDEYGVDANPDPPPTQPPSGPQGYGQRYEQPSRSFTDPHRQGASAPGRRNSFEAGEETRAFSSSTAQPPQDYPQQGQVAQGPAGGHIHPALRQASGAESDYSDTPEHRRDFSASALPPPLHTKFASASGPGDVTGSPSASRFPPRKSSIGQVESPSMMPPRDRAPSNPGKPLPFVRPADIYRRMEEERQRERASLDEDRPRANSLGKSPEPDRSLHPPLEPVAERKSEYLPDFDGNTQTQVKPQQQAQSSAVLPSARDIVSNDQDGYGFRSVVDQAFDRTDDQRSVPPTPISKSDSGVSRSNTDSTSGISPIMSRVPSSAAAALKARNLAGGDGSTPAIAEESGETSTPGSRPTSATHFQRKPSPSYSRGLATPSPGDSPARSPAIEPQRFMVEPEAAQLNTLSPSTEKMWGGADEPSSTYASREADIASALTKPDRSNAQLGAAEIDSQKAFLESHNAQSSVSDAVARSRSESPSKGRVQELAGKFGDVSQSRRGSTQSSRNSLQSWERSPDNSLPSSPIKASSPVKDDTDTSARPAAGREASFRPKLPGQWESYATSAATPYEQDRQFGVERDLPRDQTSSLQEADLTPTTGKRPVSLSQPALSVTEDPLTALKAAGSAVAEALQTSVGFAPSHNEKQPSKSSSYGNVFARPLQLDRTESSVSTIAPTPPAKDTPGTEMPPPPPLKDASLGSRSTSISQPALERPSMVQQLSTDPSVHDQESDRLRKEIVASLGPSPLGLATVPAGESGQKAPSTTLAGDQTRNLANPYNSHQVDGDREPSHALHDQDSGLLGDALSGAGHSTTAIKSQPQVEAPSLLTRFSWEASGSHLTTPNSQSQTGVTTRTSKGPESEEKLPSPAIEQAARENGDRPVDYFPNPYFGPVHSVAKPIVDEANLQDASTPTLATEKPTGISTLEEPAEAPKVSGLHVVNSALNPEAVDLPPRLSREVSPVSPPPRFSQDGRPSSDVSDKADFMAAPLTEHPAYAPLAESNDEEHLTSESAQGAAAADARESAAKPPVSDKPLGFKDISNIKTSSERVATYNQTREYWAHADHGLSDWITSAVSTNPELTTQSYPPPRPGLATSRTSRHKPTASIPLFGKHHGSSPAEQSSSSPSQAPLTPTSGPTHTAGGRSASLQMQTKGKDLLHSAGMLGGKGMTGAKGLFAKGKSRFKSDKATSLSEMSSREASEEPPELVTRSTEGSRGRMSIDTTTDSVKEEKKRRRFSSPFHRSSRSRSRPTSIALPSSTFLDFGTPKGTPSRETLPAMTMKPRPYSYHAPEAWMNGPEPQATTSGLQAPDRLGVLPSPAKSAFSLFAPKDRDVEEDIPPVPPIPDGVSRMGRRRRSDDSANQRLLQSVIRYSTPPVGEGFGKPPMFAAATTKEPEGSEDSMAGHQQMQSAATVRHRGSVGWNRPRTKASTLGPQQTRQTETDKDDQPPQPTHESLPSEPRSLVAVPRPMHTVEFADVSPVLSRVGPDRLHGGGAERDDERHLQPKRHASTPAPRLSMGDVSPMFSPARLALGSPSDTDRRHTPVEDQTPVQRDYRPAYETELIGGDISPVLGNDETTPTKAGHGLSARAGHKPWTRQSTPGQTKNQLTVTVDPPYPAVQMSPQHDALVDGALDPTPRAAQPLQQPQSLSASRYQVVHAIQHVPSHSSQESWEQDSVAAPSQSDGSQLGEKHDDTDIPPVPRKPSLARRVKHPEQAVAADAQPVVISAPKTSTQAQTDAAQSDSAHQARQQFPDPRKGTPGHHKRSESLLSKISSLVPTDNMSIAPVSSQDHRSPPPTGTHQRQQGPPAKAAPSPAQIIKGSDVQAPKNSRASNGEFDLYADHNGIVKDMHDEMGQPLRVATANTSRVMNAPRPPVPKVPAPQSMPTPKPVEEEQARYSGERPMSFISGPRDSHGRPQDILNRPTTASSERFTPSMSPSPGRRQGKPPNGTANIGSAQAQRFQQPLGPPIQEGSEGGLLGSHSVSSINTQRSRFTTPPHSTVSPPPPSNASPPPQPNAPPGLSQRPLLEAPRVQSGQHDPRTYDSRLMQDPRVMMEARMRAASPGQPVPQDPRMQGPSPAHDPHMQGQVSGSSAGLRNQYELQPQMWQQHPATDLRFRSSLLQAPGFTPSPPPAQPVQKEEKSSRPRISSVFKGLGRSHSSTPQASQSYAPQPALRPDGRMNSAVSALSGNSKGRSSHPSSIGDLPAEQIPSDRIGNVAAGPPTGHYSTNVQVPDSRPGAGYSQSLAPFQGIPPQQPPPDAPLPPVPQNYRASMSGLPEAKKKRFSSLGNLFSRSGTTGHSTPTKPKMSKEEKKAQKAQKHSTLPPMQPSSGYPWAPQQQMDLRQSGLAYSPPAGRPFPGMKNVPLQPIQQQTVSPTYPQGRPPRRISQQNMALMPPQGMQPLGVPQQLMQPPQGYHHQAQSPMQEQMLRQQAQQEQMLQQHARQEQLQWQQQNHREGSAFTTTQQIRARQGQQIPQPPVSTRQEGSASTVAKQIRAQQAHQAPPDSRQERSAFRDTQQIRVQQSQQQPQSARSDARSQRSSSHQSGQQAERTAQRPPIAEYYNADAKRYDLPQQTPQQRDAQQQDPRFHVPGLQRHEHQDARQQDIQRRQPPDAQLVNPSASAQQQQGYHQKQQHQPQPRPQSVTSQHRGAHNEASQSPAHGIIADNPVAQRHVDYALNEPQYDTPQIPAAYTHVSGAYVSPGSARPTSHVQGAHPAQSRFSRQTSDPQMQPISPQVSAMTQAPSNTRNHSSSSAVSVVSTTSNQPPDVPDSAPPQNQKPPKPRMTSITEQTNYERPWNLDLPHGATEQEIVRARQRQYMEQQLAAQEQIHAERTGRSPSPRMPQNSQTPSPRLPQNHQQSLRPTSQNAGGFREVLPRSSPQPHPTSQALQQQAPSQSRRQEQRSSSPKTAQPTPVRPEQVSHPASVSLPMSPDSASRRSPMNSVAGLMPPPPPPKIPHTPMYASFPESQTPPPALEQSAQDRDRYSSHQMPQEEIYPPSKEKPYQVPQEQHPSYQDQTPADEPPPYSGPDVSNDGMEKERHRPPNIITNADDRGRQFEPRQRQISIGMLQHPQPASMAASPQRSSADMGADSLRRQLLVQEERARQERAQREQMLRVESARERTERERARARARELERSISGGGRVGSLRAPGSTRSTNSGWERRGDTARPVFELPAEEDDEPVMRATSFPGQEWVPTWSED